MRKFVGFFHLREVSCAINCVFKSSEWLWSYMILCCEWVAGRPDTSWVCVCVCVCVMGTAGWGNEYRGRGDGCEWSSCDRWANRCSPQPSERCYLWAGKDSQTQSTWRRWPASALIHIMYISRTLSNAAGLSQALVCCKEKQLKQYPSCYSNSSN